MLTSMTKLPKTFMAFRPDPEMAKAMAKLTDRDGISTSEQIRRALRQWLKAKGVYKEKRS
jgi:ribbon-helix-helix CopG family protein